MKRLLLLVLCALALIEFVSADELVVNTLLYKSTDLSASTQPRLDQNGKPCGLLKVITSDDKMTFEGSAVGNIEYKNGEYWVYLPEGTYMLKIKTEKKDPLLLDFRKYNLSQVQSKATYELTFYYGSYEPLSKRCNKHIQGPKITKRYAVVLLTVPTLDYVKRMVNEMATEGDALGEKHDDLTIMAYVDAEEGITMSYSLIYQEDDELWARFFEDYFDYWFTPKIYVNE
jgi:hypothetical protein